MTNTNWRDDALCRQVDAGELFFPDRGESPRPAQAVCLACAVRAECLEEALVSNMRFGIWGGATERERRALRKLRGLNTGQRPETTDTVPETGAA